VLAVGVLTSPGAAKPLPNTGCPALSWCVLAVLTTPATAIFACKCPPLCMRNSCTETPAAEVSGVPCKECPVMVVVMVVMRVDGAPRWVNVCCAGWDKSWR